MDRVTRNRPGGPFHERFRVLSADVSEETVCIYARAYIMMLLSTQLFGDKSGNWVHIRWLPFVVRLVDMGSFSWGSAALAWLYRCMCRMANRNVTNFADTQDAIPTKLKQIVLFSFTAANLKDQSPWVPDSPFLLPKSVIASCPISSWTESAPCSWTTCYATVLPATLQNLPKQQSECRSFSNTIVVLGGLFSAVFLSRRVVSFVNLVSISTAAFYFAMMILRSRGSKETLLLLRRRPLLLI
ncbi:hypothetical protein Ahy_A08g039493 [Arachis hypogaea]|uniref:Aminotransferase-like plant mobile domain-containing protein n=1 Tax=Arachis hypogaea TaxID=3818 RepID=A0A445BWG4_ARAHY|nr:hypothetical protein Ahy_A08g039493 [Arachis hypogaea]